MKPNSLLFPILLLVATLGAQGVQTTLTAEVGDCGPTLQLYKYTGFNFEPLVPLTKTEGGSYRVSLSFEEPVFRYVGSSPQDAVAVILGVDAEVTVSGSCGSLQTADIRGGHINEEYQLLRARFEHFNERYTTLIQDIQVIEDERVNREARAAMTELDHEKAELVEKMQSMHPLLGRVASLNTYLSVNSADSSASVDQLSHYLSTYFQFVDFDDRGYDDLSLTYDAGRAFASNLVRAVAGPELGEMLIIATEDWKPATGARFLLRSGALSALLAVKHPGVLPLADALLAEYGEAYPGPAAAIRNAVSPLRLGAVGTVAPTFSALSPDGETISLDSLRGKVVLLDFWASWCAPCRRENPSVVRMYERFRDRNFEILGISLDERRERWEGAIAADGLEWLHVSDLRGWQSEIGQLYGVTSIPQTLLLDGEGKVLARNLRGPDLERKLEQVLGQTP